MTLPLLEDEPRKLDAVIIGAGVTGLSIGLELVKRGYKIAIVAKDMPEDDQSPGFASPWAVSSVLLTHSFIREVKLTCHHRAAIGVLLQVGCKAYPALSYLYMKKRKEDTDMILLLRYNRPQTTTKENKNGIVKHTKLSSK